MTNWLLGVVLGLVQGVSEWLPVSSKTQIIIVSTYLFGLTFKQAYAFGLFLEAGTFFGALFYFRSEVWRVLLALVGRGDKEGMFILRYLVIVTLVTGVIGVAILKLVSDSITGLALGVPMVILGIILISDGFLIKLARGRYLPRKGMTEISLRDQVLIGVAQGIAALPGISRSGATVSAMLLLGVKPEESFRLSFLALLPASIGAAAATLLLEDTQVVSVVNIVTPPVVLLAIVVSALVSILLIRMLLRFAAGTKITILVYALGLLAVLSGAASILTGYG